MVISLGLEVDNFSEFTPNLPPFNLVNKIPTTGWSNLTGEELYCDINKAYDTIVHWQKNLFMLPSGKQNKEFIKELSSWLNKFNNDSAYQFIALKACMILPSLLLQKPSKKSKAKEHSLKLSQWLILWREGNIMVLLHEEKTIQKHLQKQSRSREEIEKVFTRLMLQEKVTAALEFLDNEVASCGILPLTP